MKLNVTRKCSECKEKATAIIEKRYVCKKCFEKLKPKNKINEKRLRKSWLDEWLEKNGDKK